VSHRLIRIGDYSVSVDHLSSFEHEYKNEDPDVKDPRSRRPGYLCIFTIKFENTYTVYFRHLSIEERDKHLGREDLARYLIENLKGASAVRSFKMKGEHDE